MSSMAWKTIVLAIGFIGVATVLAFVLWIPFEMAIMAVGTYGAYTVFTFLYYATCAIVGLLLSIVFRFIDELIG